jgi:hypothetical protein
VDYLVQLPLKARRPWCLSESYASCKKCCDSLPATLTDLLSLHWCSMSVHNNNQQLLWGVLLGSLVTVSCITLYNNILSGKKHTSHMRRDSLDVDHLCPPGNMRGMEIVDGVDGLIGNTPLMRIRSLSEATGCTILVSISNEWCNAVALS